MTPRGQILEDARALTEGARNETYGEPVTNMLIFAQLLDGYFQARGFALPDGGVSAVDACRIMQMTKWARDIAGETNVHRDNFVDDTAYGSMAYECALSDRS